MKSLQLISAIVMFIGASSFTFATPLMGTTQTEYGKYFIGSACEYVTLKGQNLDTYIIYYTGLKEGVKVGVYEVEDVRICVVEANGVRKNIIFTNNVVFHNAGIEQLAIKCNHKVEEADENQLCFTPSDFTRDDALLYVAERLPKLLKA